MENKKKIIEPLPDSFATEKEAGEFWDTHSAMDYVKHLETTDDEIEIKSRVFEVQISEDVDENEWMQAAAKNEMLNFLNDTQEDIYSLTDGKPLEQR